MASAKVRLVDVARAASVSVSAASVALCGKPGVAVATRARVLRAAKDLGYVRDAAAAGLRSGRSGLVGLVAPTLAHPLVDPLVVAGPALGMLFAVAGPDDVQALIDRAVDALVLVEAARGVTAWVRTGRPLVCVAVECAPRTSVRLHAHATAADVLAALAASFATA